MITVLMPTYNGAKFVAGAIRSTLYQTFKDFEFLIIDDGSTDNTKEIVSSFNDLRIRYIFKGHSGISDTLNYGLQIASYDLIARMDADDVMAPARLAKEYLELKSKGPKSIVSCWCAYFSKGRIKYIINGMHDSREIKKKLLLHSHFPHSGVMYNKNLVLDYGGYRGDVFEDYDLWLRMSNKVEFNVIPLILQFQQLRKDSLSRKDVPEKRQQYYNIQEPYYKSSFKVFGVESKDEMNLYKGWREYFVGKKYEARKYWRKLGLNALSSHRLVFAFMLSYLPVNVLSVLNQLSLRYRINYLFHYFSKDSRSSRFIFKYLVHDS